MLGNALTSSVLEQTDYLDLDVFSLKRGSWVRVYAGGYSFLPRGRAGITPVKLGHSLLERPIKQIFETDIRGHEGS